MPSSSSKPSKKPARLPKLKRIAIIAAGIIVVAALSFPIWSVWFAKPLAALAGVEVQSVEALTWDRWEIRGLTLEQPTAKVEVANIQLPSPAKLAQLYLSSGPGTQTLTIEDWSVEMSIGGETETSQAEAQSLGELVQMGKDGLTQFGYLLEAIRITDGSIRIDDVDTLSVPSITFSPSAFNANFEYLPQATPLEIEATFSESWTINFQASTYEISSKLEFFFTEERVKLQGEVLTSKNPIDLSAEWIANNSDFLPTQVSLSTQRFALDDRYSIWAQAPRLYLDSTITWIDQTLDYRISGSDSLENATGNQIEIEGTGSLDLLEIETANIDLPYLEVRNNGPIRIDPKLENPLSDAQLTAKLDLGQIPAIEAAGIIIAQLKTVASDDDLPIIAGNLNGSRIVFYDTEIEKVSGELKLHGQDLQLNSFDLKTVAGSTLSGKGGFDFATNTIASTDLKVALLNESKLLSGFAPDLNWESLVSDIHLEGPAANATIRATLNSHDLQLPGANPFGIEADVTGTFTDIKGTLYAKNDSQIFQLEFASESSAKEKNLSVSKLDLTTLDSEKLLALESPFSIRIQNEDSSISSNGLSLSGANDLTISLQNISLTQERLGLNTQIDNLDPSIFNSWLREPLPPTQIRSISSQASIDQNGASLKSEGLAHWSIDESNTIDISWLATAEPDASESIKIDSLRIGADDKDIISANGTFPLSIKWIQGSAVVAIDSEAPLAFSLRSSQNPDFWNALNEVLPVSIKQPIIDAKLEGSVSRPKGRFDISLDSLVWHDPEATERSIEVRDLKTTLLADSSALSLETLEAHSGENTIQAQATLSLGDRPITELLENLDAIDLQELDAKATVALLDLEALKAWLPGMLRYNGQANISLNVDEGEISASGEIKNIATRALPPLAALSDISGDFQFEDGIFKTQGISGIADKSPFTLVGQADINSIENPLFDLNFSSKEFPLVRDDGLIVSGDIDMNVVSADDGQTQIQGELILKKGLALLEPDLLASSTTTVSSRPPYFAVEQAPFNEWGLDIAIRGDQFLRVSNSYFQGTLSAEFDLEGSLGAPLLIGKAETYGGRIFFPASSLKLKTGQGFITRDRPSELQIEALAEGRLFAYDINLDVQGTADNPEMVITSNPALTQVEALLLLTTGAIPNDGGNLAQQSATSLGMFIGKGLFKKLTGGNSDSASKLNLEVGQDISQQGKKTIEATYQLSEDLELEGEYDKRDEFNANLKWTIFKR